MRGRLVGSDRTKIGRSVRTGRIAEQGTHEELLALNAEYRKLHDLQFHDVDAVEAKVLH